MLLKGRLRMHPKIGSRRLRRLDRAEELRPRQRPNYHDVSDEELELMLRHAQLAEEETGQKVLNELSENEKKQLTDAYAKVRIDWVWPRASRQKSVRS